MIRCDHCGWSNNPDEAKRCQKCNQELVVMPPVPVGGGYLEENKTAQEGCPKCGYPVAQDVSFCPNCGAAVGNVQSSAADSSMKKTVRDLPSEMKEGAVVSTDMKQTMRDVRIEAPSQTPRDIPVADNQHSDKASFRLKPVDVETSGVFTFGAEADAAFEFVDGQWYISDNGRTDSVYVRASRRILLQKGDVVIIGGRRYSFD